MNGIKNKLTLDQRVTYRIQVPGELDAHWVDWGGKMGMEVEGEGGDLAITTLTGCMDQAALHGLLHRLYSLGLPLISVTLVAFERADHESES